MDPRTIQLLLGHRSLDTPARYLRVARTPLANVQSPFDLLRVDMIPPHHTGLRRCAPLQPPVTQGETGQRAPQQSGKLLTSCASMATPTQRLTPYRHPTKRSCTTSQCAQCGFERYADNSCRHRHGPKCQTLAKAPWLDARQADLLAVPYFHCVFPLPHDLTPLVLTNKRALFPLRLRATSQTLLQFGPHHLGGQLGGLWLLHTWDQTLKAHCHGHALVPGGALADQGTRGVPTPPRCLFPVQALSRVFRAKFLDTPHHRREPWGLPEQTASLETAHGFQRGIDRLYDQAWVIYAKRSMAGPGQGLDYLGRYTHRVAIANHRLIDVHHGQVRFPFRNRRQGNRLETMTLPAHECIRCFLLPVVPHGLQRLRHMGFLANRCKAQALRQCRQLLNHPAPPRPQNKTIAEWLWQWTGTDVTRCPHCGHGPLQRLPLAALPPRARHPGVPLVWDSS